MQDLRCRRFARCNDLAGFVPSADPVDQCRAGRHRGAGQQHPKPMLNRRCAVSSRVQFVCGRVLRSVCTLPLEAHRYKDSTIGTASSRYVTWSIGALRSSANQWTAAPDQDQHARRDHGASSGTGHAPQAAPGTQRNCPPDLSAAGNSGTSCAIPPPECERVNCNPARSSGPAGKAAAPHFEDSTKSAHAGWCAMASKKNRSSSSCDRGLSGIDVSINFIKVVGD